MQWQTRTSKQLYNLKKLYNRNIKVENNSSGKSQVDFGEQKRRTILEKCFPQLFSVYLIQAHFCKEKLYLTRLTPGIWSIPKGSFLKWERTKEEISQHVLSIPVSVDSIKNDNIASTSFSALLCGPCIPELISYNSKGFLQNKY